MSPQNRGIHMSKADIKRNTVTDHPAQNLAKSQLQLAGKNLAPTLFKYEGSAAVHFYRMEGTDTYAFISQLADIYTLPEGQVDVGLKELRRMLMDTFGREDKRRLNS
jgi:hypothetical protein